MLGKSTNLIASNGIIFFVVEIAGFIRAESESFRAPNSERELH
jgi:hypothetical protein